MSGFEVFNLIAQIVVVIFLIVLAVYMVTEIRLNVKAAKFASALMKDYKFVRKDEESAEKEETAHPFEELNRLS